MFKQTTMTQTSKKNCPDILGRTAGDPAGDESVRNTTTLVAAASAKFDAVAAGTAKVEIFKSNGSMDEGGYVIRATVTNDCSAFTPHAVCLPNGIELHIAGDIEARALIAALTHALDHLQFQQLARHLAGGPAI